MTNKELAKQKCISLMSLYRMKKTEEGRKKLEEEGRLYKLKDIVGRKPDTRFSGFIMQELNLRVPLTEVEADKYLELYQDMRAFADDNLKGWERGLDKKTIQRIKKWRKNHKRIRARTIFGVKMKPLTREEQRIKSLVDSI